MSRITTLVFDIGNVLNFFSFEAIAESTSGFTALPTREIKEILIKWSHPFCTGEIDETQFAEKCIQDLKFTGTPADLKTAYNAGFSANEKMLPVIERLKPDYPLFYLSDTNPWHLEHLVAEYPVFRHFKGGTTSFGAQALKPDAAIYQHAARTHRYSPIEAVFVDDRQANVAGAESVGYTGIHYDPADHDGFEARLTEILGQ